MRKLGPRWVSARFSTSSMADILSILSMRAPNPEAIPCISSLGSSKSMPTKRVVSIVAPPEVFEQPVLVIHKAYEYRWDGVLGREAS
jgi:hypothetical protein